VRERVGKSERERESARESGKEREREGFMGLLYAYLMGPTGPDNST